MNINIALNTIIYIMVFLFPGVLFRKFYFLDKHKNQFHQGNLFERFLLTILTSIVCILCYTFLFEFLLNDYLELRLINQIQYSEFLELFKALSNNTIPDFLSKKQKFIDFSSLFISIYFFSAGFGFLLFKVVTYFKFDHFFSFLRFNNEWDYLFYAPSGELKKIKKDKILSVNIDVLTKTKDKEVLYQGDLYKVLYNKDNELDGIAIRNVHRFLEIEKTKENANKIKDIQQSIQNKEYKYISYRDYTSKHIFKRSINSDIFVINKSEIVNYNIVYLTKFKPFTKKPLLPKLLAFTTLLFIFSTAIFLFILPFISIENKYFNSVWSRILFSMYTFIQLLVTIGSLGNFTQSKQFSQKMANLLLLLLFGIFYLWFFEIFQWYYCILISIGIIVVFGLLKRLSI